MFVAVGNKWSTVIMTAPCHSADLISQNLSAGGNSFSLGSVLSLSAQASNVGTGSVLDNYTDSFHYQYGISGTWNSIGDVSKLPLDAGGVSDDAINFTPPQAGPGLFIRHCVDTGLVIDESNQNEDNNCSDSETVGPIEIVSKTPLVNFDVCDQFGNNCTHATTTEYGTPLTLKWNATNADGCMSAGNSALFSTGGNISGSVNISAQTSATNKIFSIACNYMSGIPVTESVSVSVFATSSALAPELIVNGLTNKKIVFVEAGDSPSLEWNTQGVNESSCSIEQKMGPTFENIVSSFMLPGADDPLTGILNTSAINARSKFILTCLDKSVSVEVNLIPSGGES